MRRDGTLCPLRLEPGNRCTGAGIPLADCDECPDARPVRLLHFPLVPVTMMVWCPAVGFVPSGRKAERCSCGGPWPCEKGGDAT